MRSAVSRSTLDLAEQRHTDDSLQLLALAPDTATRWIDLGSGGGFPGLVIAIAAVEHRPAMHVTLIESDADLVTELEKDFNATLPLLIEKSAAPEKFEAAVEAMNAKLDRAQQILEQAAENKPSVF